MNVHKKGQFGLFMASLEILIYPVTNVRTFEVLSRCLAGLVSLERSSHYDDKRTNNAWVVCIHRRCPLSRARFMIVWVSSCVACESAEHCLWKIRTRGPLLQNELPLWNMSLEEERWREKKPPSRNLLKEVGDGTCVFLLRYSGRVALSLGVGYC